MKGKRILRTVLVACGLLVLGAGVQLFLIYTEVDVFPIPEGIVVEKDVPVVMRDGVKLYDLDIGILLGMEKEVLEGRGPIRLEPSEVQIQAQFVVQFQNKWLRPRANEFWGRLGTKELQYGADHSPRPEAIPGFIGELSPVRVNHEMKTSLDGLWAIGDTSYGGSAWAGAVPSLQVASGGRAS